MSDQLQEFHHDIAANDQYKQHDQSQRVSTIDHSVVDLKHEQSGGQRKYANDEAIKNGFLIAVTLQL